MCNNIQTTYYVEISLFGRDFEDIQDRGAPKESKYVIECQSICLQLLVQSMITVSQMQGLSGVPGAVGEKGKRGERVSCDIIITSFLPRFGTDRHFV